MNMRIIVLGAAIVCGSGLLRAQGLTVPSSVIDHGGGRGVGGSYSVELSIGQPLAGEGGGAPFSVNGGFVPLLGAFAGFRVSFTLAMANGWNMISVPPTPDDYARTALFPTASSGAFAYDNGYAEHAALENGRGYWIKFAGGQPVAMAGLPREKDTIVVAAGWNLIGSLSAPMPTSNIASIPPGMITSEFFWYDQGYETGTSLEPGKAYWVRVWQPAELVLDATLPGPPAASIRIMRTDERPPPPPDDGPPSQRGLPREYSLSQNYPNPFNPATRIDFGIPASGMVALRVYNMLGQEVATVVSEVREAGYGSLSFDGSNLPSGVYTYRLTAGGFTQVRKMILIR